MSPESPMQFMNKLKSTSVYRILLNNYFICVLFVLIFLIGLNHIWVMAFILIYGFLLYMKEKVILILSLVFCFIITINFIFLKINNRYQELSKADGIITEIDYHDKYNKLTIRNKGSYILVYDYNFMDLKIGDVIKVSGQPMKVNGARIEKGFDYLLYLQRKKIIGIILSEEIIILKHSFHINQIKYGFITYINNNFDENSRVYLKALVLGNSEDFSDELQEAVKNNGIMHLFAVSGLHITLFVGLLYKLLKSFDIKEGPSTNIIIIFLILYMIITSFSPSVVRASLMYFFTIASKHFKLGLSSIDVISIVFLLLLSVNPYFMYDIGFQLSFIASFTIILTSIIIKEKSSYMQIFIISVFCTLSTLPLVVNINNKINILSPLINVLYIEIVSSVILPLSFIIIVLPVIQIFYRFIVITFTHFTLLISEMLLLNIVFPDFTIITTILYYLAILGLIKFFKYRKLKYCAFTIFGILLFVISNISFFKTEGEIHFLDLNNGEAIFIHDRFNQCRALIDTGDGKNYEVTSFLLNHGIKSLDYLIITHNHLDHNGEVQKIIEEINVNNVVVSAYDNSGYAHLAIKKVKSGDSLKCGKIKLDIVHPDKKYQNENDNSIVVHSKIGPYNFLFLGDVSKNIEDKLINLNLKVDVIKIAHHGSITSTSKKLIASVKPKYAIIQTGQIEKFGFPHQQVIAILNENKVIIYRTDENFSIRYKFTKNKSIFKTIR